MTDFITHNSTSPPELAPAALVEYQTLGGLRIKQVKDIVWLDIFENEALYRPLTNDEGHKLISAEGLDRVARFVTTDEDGTVIQWGDVEGLWVFHPGIWRADQGLNPLWLKAPDTHRHPSDWRNSLYKVYRND